jgi:UDP-N-acetylglucosamine--N-acetylmuramyl-(pentapeptide) pyrophosphoryl-undecaprenol N-acetylglucosamine transferase
MEVLYSAADIVVSRCGASTLAEVSFYGLPAILIPHPQGGSHQRENAVYFQERGAAVVFNQSSFSFEDFKAKLEELILNRDLRQAMGESASAINLGVNFEDFCTANYI